MLGVQHADSSAVTQLPNLPVMKAVKFNHNKLKSLKCSLSLQILLILYCCDFCHTYS